MRTWAIFWLSSVLLSTPVLADDADVFKHPQSVGQAQSLLRAAIPNLDQAEVLRGRYSQRKFLDEIPRPLNSTGEFLLVRERGLWWHTQTPLDSELILTPDTLKQQIEKKSGSSGNHDRGRLGGGASLFFALFALDLDTLARSFDLFATQSGTAPAGTAPETHWQLGLRPRDASLAAWIREITVTGGSQVEHLNLIEATGDRTEIDLGAVAQPLFSLTPAERQRFEP